MPYTATEYLMSATNLVPVTPGNTDLAEHQGLWVGGGGSLDVTLLDGRTVSIVGINPGTLLPLRVKQINGGTASNVLLWT